MRLHLLERRLQSPAFSRFPRSLPKLEREERMQWLVPLTKYPELHKRRSGWNQLLGPDFPRRSPICVRR